MISPWFWRSVSTVSPSLDWSLETLASAALRAACKVVALDDGDELPGLHLLAFLDGRASECGRESWR